MQQRNWRSVVNTWHRYYLLTVRKRKWKHNVTGNFVASQIVSYMLLTRSWT